MIGNPPSNHQVHTGLCHHLWPLPSSCPQPRWRMISPFRERDTRTAAAKGSDEGGDDGLSSSSGDECGATAENSRC